MLPRVLATLLSVLPPLSSCPPVQEAWLLLAPSQKETSAEEVWAENEAIQPALTDGQLGIVARDDDVPPAPAVRVVHERGARLNAAGNNEEHVRLLRVELAQRDAPRRTPRSQGRPALPPY
jgi:hypothetical protein